MNPALQDYEVERIERARPTNLNAWELYLKALHTFHERSQTDHKDPDLELARELSEKSISLDQSLSVAHSLMSEICIAELLQHTAENSTQTVEDILAHGRCAAELDSKNPRASDSISRHYFSSGKFEQAKQYAQRAVKLNPSYPEAHNSLGQAFVHSGFYSDAERHFNKAIELNSNYANAFSNRGEVLKKLGLKEASIDDYQRSLELNPEIEYIKGELINTKMHLCIWNNFNSQVSELIDQIKNDKKVSSPFPLLSLVDELSILKKVSEIYVNDKYASIKQPKFESFKQNKSKIKIGYFSPDFRKHPVATLSAEIYELHDKDNFEIHGFYSGRSFIINRNLMDFIFFLLFIFLIILFIKITKFNTLLFMRTT